MGTKPTRVTSGGISDSSMPSLCVSLFSLWLEGFVIWIKLSSLAVMMLSIAAIWAIWRSIGPGVEWNSFDSLKIQSAPTG